MQGVFDGGFEEEARQEKKTADTHWVVYAGTTKLVVRLVHRDVD